MGLGENDVGSLFAAANEGYVYFRGGMHTTHAIASANIISNSFPLTWQSPNFTANMHDRILNLPVTKVVFGMYLTGSKWTEFRRSCPSNDQKFEYGDWRKKTYKLVRAIGLIMGIRHPMLPNVFTFH